MTLTIGSLFAGFGGLDMAVEEAFGATTAWVSEIDPGACKVLAHRFPDAPNLGDITTVDWATVEPVDIITGGSPCQDLSTAGRRAGMTDGTRSNLWVAMREAIAQLRPRFVVWENVRGALSAHAHSDLESCAGCVGDERDEPALRALGRVLGDLAELGFDAEWRGLRASDVGACHQRFRVFVLAWRRDAAHADGIGHERRWRTRLGRTGPADGDSEFVMLPTPRATRGGSSTETTALLPTPRATDGAKGGPGQRGSKGDLMLPSAVAQIERNETCSSGSWDESVAPSSMCTSGREAGMGMPLTIAVQLLPTPTVTQGRNETSGRSNPDSQHHTGTTLHDVVFKGDLLPTTSVADAMGGHERRGGKRGNELLLKGIATHEQFGQYAPAIARQEQAFGYPAPSPTEPGKNGRPRLSARFAEWMMGAPPGWITDVPGVTRNEALRMAGNGVVRQQALAALLDMQRAVTKEDRCATRSLDERTAS